MRSRVSGFEISARSAARVASELSKVVASSTMQISTAASTSCFAATVFSLAEVKAVMEELKSSSKIARATHNMFAYRIEGEKNTSLLQDCDDDGEDAAGGRMLHLLQLLDVKNVLVVVSRWYGGVHLGPDRFKHINNAARQVLELAGLISDRPVKKKGPQSIK